ncbi:hypothetical protein HKD37_07G019524 [Glycine soja]
MRPKVERPGSLSGTSMTEKKMMTMIVDTLPVFYYEKMVGYTPSSFDDMVFTDERIKVARKPVEFTPIPVSYADLLPYLLDNSMVAITLAMVHQPPFLREYDSNATCACHGEAPGRSIEHCRALKCKVQGLIDAGWLKFEENRV